MKHGRRIIATMLVIITLLACLPVSAFAAYQYEPLKFNSWYRLKDSSSDMKIYTLKVPSDTVIIINWKNNDADNSWGYGSICKDKKCDNDVFSFLGIYVNSSGQTGVVLYPGTYYVRMYDEKGTARVKLTKKTVGSINKQNYCLQKAIHMKQNKKVEFAQTRKYCYDRWFRIKLTKSQKIKIIGNRSLWYYLYDSNFNEVRCIENDDDDAITTYGKQPKGTYYLVVRADISDLLLNGTYYTIYWKQL